MTATKPPITSQREDMHRRFLNAAIMDKLDEMKDILAQDPSIYKGINGETAGFLAVHNNRHEIIHFLLEEIPASLEDKAIISRGDLDRPPLARIAIERSQSDTTNLLLKYDTTCTHHKSKEGISMLMLALFYNQIDAARTLLDRGANATEVSINHQRSCLHWASYAGIEGIKLIYPHTSHMLETTDEKGYTPLLAAAQSHTPESVAFLLAQKANIHATDLNGCSALHLATNDRRGQTTDRDETRDNKAYAVMTMLLDAGADINLQDNGGQTALMRAEMLGLRKTADMLIAKGADLSLNDKNGETVLEHVKENDAARWSEIQHLQQSAAEKKIRDNIDAIAKAAFNGTQVKTPLMRKIVLRPAP